MPTKKGTTAVIVLTLLGVGAAAAARGATKAANRPPWHQHPSTLGPVTGAALEFQEINTRHREAVSALIVARSHMPPTTLSLGLIANQARDAVRDPVQAPPQTLHAYGEAVLALEENIRDLLFDPAAVCDPFTDTVPVGMLDTRRPHTPHTRT